MVYLIAYDLKQDPDHYDYQKFYDYIENHDGACLSSSAYLIASENTPDEIYEAISPFVDPEDWVLLTAISKPCAGTYSTEVTDWLSQNL